MSKHTPTPWRSSEDNEIRGSREACGRSVGAIVLNGGCLADSDAALIVRAVNAHAALVSALERLYADEKLDDDDPRLAESREMAREALKLAKGE